MCIAYELCTYYKKKSLQRNIARCIIKTCGYRKIKGDDIFLMRVPTDAKFCEDWMKVFDSPPPSIHSPKDIVYIFQLFKELYTSETSLAQKMVFNIQVCIKNKYLD